MWPDAYIVVAAGTRLHSDPTERRWSFSGKTIGSLADTTSQMANATQSFEDLSADRMAEHGR
jgi:hypothetical protein